MVIQVREAVVRIGNFRLGPVALDVAPGSITAVLGSNGSGKTTLIRALLGLVPVEAGAITVAGRPAGSRDPRMLREVGFAPDDDAALIEELTAPELWRLHARIHARVAGDPEDMVAHAVEVARRLDFEPPRTSIGSFSHGMKKKTQLAAALMHRPQVLVLDEPRNGLDPLGIERLEALLRSERDAGTSCLVASHDLRWAERVADRVILLAEGRVVANAAPLEVAGTGGNFVSAFFDLVGNGRRDGGDL